MGLAAALASKAVVPGAREIVAVADRAYASLKLLDRCRKLSNPITFITRLRLDALPFTNRLRHDARVR